MGLGTFAFSPYLAVYFAVLFQSFLLISYVFFNEDYEPNKLWKKYIYDFVMFFGLSLFFLFGLIFLDTGICWLTGQWGYADWRFQLPSVILITILGFQYIIGTMLIKPRITDLIFAIISASLILIIMHVYLPGGDLLEGAGIVLLVISVLQVSYLILWVVNSILDNKTSWKDKNRILWDVEFHFKKYYNRKINVILWILVIIEAFLKLGGTSIFLW